ncbi:MAG: hypothetical protein ACTSVB_09245 [Candidatus Heimdallarchaeaceae archaeon]
MVFEFIATKAPLALLLVIGVGLKEEFAKGFTGRSALVANTVSIFTAGAINWQILPTWFQMYALIGILFGVIAFATYITNTSLPTIFYKITFYAYNSIFAIIICLWLSGI